MSGFSGLTKQRKVKDGRSFVSSDSAPRVENLNVVGRNVEETNEMDIDSESRTEGTQPTKTSNGTTQLNVEGLYKQLPPALDIRISSDDSGKGRGIYSRYYRKPGDVLLSIKPHVAALSIEHLDECCSNCFAQKPTSLQRCTGCKLLHYCDSKCQSADWSFHKNECAAIQKWTSANSGSAPIPGDAIRCLGRILWREQKLGRDSIWAREIDALQSHRTSLSKDPSSHDSQIYTQLAHAIVRFLGLNSPQDMAEYGLNSAAELVDLVSRFTTNTFTISTPALAPLGACVSPLVALINHSCDPNAVVVFPRAGGESRKEDEPLMQVIALRPIEKDEEIWTAYIDTTLPRENRQRILKETYHFTCQCNLCAPPPNSMPDWRAAMWCPKKCGGVCSLPTEDNSLTRCSRCKTPVKDTDAVLDAVRVGEEALHKAEAVQLSNPQKAIQLTTKLIPILISAGLVPAAYPLLALSRLCASLLITHISPVDPTVEEVYSPEIQDSQPDLPKKTTPEEAQEALDEAIRAATRASTGLSQILREGHPMRGIALAELGKLLAVDEPRPTYVDPPSTPPASATPAGMIASSSSESMAPPPTSSLIMNPQLKAPPYPPSGPPRLKLAYETLVRARTELTVGFGGGKNEGGEVGQQVRELAVNIEKELMVWKTGIRNALNDQPKPVRG